MQEGKFKKAWTILRRIPVLRKILQQMRDILFQYQASKEIKNKRKINVGAGNIEFSSDWFSCDKETLDITSERNWIKLLRGIELNNIFAEHVWEHLTKEETELANQNCYKFLAQNGRLRLAVPDGFHPDKDYIDHVKPEGTGAGAGDHKVLYNYITLSKSLKSAGFEISLLEYWDEKGNFHSKNWSLEEGKVKRSKRFDERNKTGQLNYTSLIIDGIKK